jgi:FKBP-type peptidyl-prolyl cis-trans isomerase (trigger factor)
LKEKDLRPITRPFLTFRKLARGNALEFSVHFSVMPEFKLPNYAKIGKEALKDMPAIVITDEEVDNTIKTIQMMRMGKDAKEAELPALTDESVKAYGDFASVLDFKTKVREHLKQEKETEEQTKTREKIITALLEATPFELPTILLAQEVADAEARREQEITRMGSTMDDYLKRIGKTKEDLATQEKEAISRGLRARFILDAIAEDGKIEPKEEDVDAHVTLLMQQYPESDPESAKAYVRDTLREEATFALLEGKAVVS